MKISRIIIFGFVQDRSPIYTAILCQKWFQERMPEQYIYLPTKAFDTNIIEFIWFTIKKRLPYHGIFESSDQFFQAIDNE
jgi:hypothetical protein